MPRLLRGASLTCLLLLLFSSIVFGQRDLGTITGTVTDPQGAAVPNAKVTIVNDATNVSYDTVTTDTGSYTRPALNPGTYTVSVDAPGFQKTQQKGIVVLPGQPVGVDIALSVGSSSLTVQVTAEAPLLQTESPAIGENLNFDSGF